MDLAQLVGVGVKLEARGSTNLNLLPSFFGSPQPRPCQVRGGGGGGVREASPVHRLPGMFAELHLEF